MKKILKYSLIFLFVMIFANLVMFAFDVCPPSGRWPTPPWCDGNSFLHYSLHPNKVNDSSSEASDKVDTDKASESLQVNDENDNSAQAKRLSEIKSHTNNNNTQKDADDVTAQNKQELRESVAENKILRSDFQKGVVFGAMKWSTSEKRFIDTALSVADEFGVSHIAIVPEWFVFPDKNGTEIKPFYYSDEEFPNTTGWVTPTLGDGELVSIIKKAKARGIAVVLKPQLDSILFGMKPGESRGSFAPSDWNAWFENYKKFILHYANIAKKEGVDILVIGTELDTAVREAPGALKKWKSLINDVRKVYSGKLTYSASCHGECWSPRQVTFWGDLDYIGFEPYFGLTNKNNPTVDEMKTAIDTKLNSYAKPLYKKYSKPILITEANVYSYDGVNKHPIDPPGGAPVDLQEQADYYYAMMQSLVEKDWIKGVYWWGWYLGTTAKNASYNTDKYDPFVRKPAGEVLRSFYNSVF